MKVIPVYFLTDQGRGVIAQISTSLQSAGFSIEHFDATSLRIPIIGDHAPKKTGAPDSEEASNPLDHEYGVFMLYIDISENQADTKEVYKRLEARIKSCLESVDSVINPTIEIAKHADYANFPEIDSAEAGDYQIKEKIKGFFDIRESEFSKGLNEASSILSRHWKSLPKENFTSFQNEI